MENKEITISMEEYKGLLIIKGKYEKLKSQQRLPLIIRDYYAREDIYRENFNSNESYEKALKEERKLRQNFDTALNLITKLKKENEKYKYLYQKALDNTVKSDKENIDLKKQIDLMAEEITTPINSKEWVKEYYKNLARQKG